MYDRLVDHFVPKKNIINGLFLSLQNSKIMPKEGYLRWNIIIYFFGTQQTESWCFNLMEYAGSGGRTITVELNKKVELQKEN